MPLAAALSNDNLKYKINEISDETEVLWERMKNIGVEGKKVNAENVVYFGVRDTEEPEEGAIEDNNIKNYTVEEIRYRGFELCLKEAVEKLESCDMIYISFDVDSMDCDMISNGTGTPVSKGFDIEEAILIIKTFIDTKKTVCFEVVEVNPTLDHKGNRMAEAAFEVLKEATTSINNQNIR
jgi:Arginase/agmatinase/formimionoglutamate hydrolase, arginase family